MFNFFKKKPIVATEIEKVIQRLGTPFGSRTCNVHTSSSDYDYFFNHSDLATIIALLGSKQIPYKSKDTYSHALNAHAHIGVTLNSHTYDLVSFSSSRQIRAMSIAAKLSKAYSEYSSLKDKQTRYFVFRSYLTLGKNNKSIDKNLLDFASANFPELLV